MKRALYLLCLIILLGSMFTGCGFLSKEIKTEDGSILKLSKDGVEVKSRDGNSQISIGGDEGVSLPEGYPKDTVPIIDNSKIVAASKNEDQSKKVTYSVMLLTEKSLSDVMAFYKEAMKDAKNLNQNSMGEAASFGGEKDEYSFWIILGTDSSGDKPQTSVTITITPKVQ